MPRTATESLVRSLGSLFEGGSVAGLSDRQLLERFAAARDAAGEAAFAGLVARHGPMVLGLCHHLLGDLHHAEDAFQAVFLVLARKARSIRDPDLLSNWLYGVALRTARCAKAQLDCRRRKEQAGTLRPPGPGSSALLELMVQPVEQPLIDREQAEALHSEISRLPSSFRLPVVLCYFEGLTLDEAARRLRCPAGTIRSRLARAREKLRRALTGRGVTLSVATLTAALSPRSAPASVSSHLCEKTTRAAIQFAAGQSAAPLAADLANDVLKSMLANNLRLTVLTVLLFGTVATGAGYFVQDLAKNDELKSRAADRQSGAAARPDDGIPPAARMFVAGRVFDPAGKEMAGVSIEIVGHPREPVLSTTVDGDRHRLLGRGVSTAGGRFSFEASRTSAHRFFEVYALAAAPGFGLGWSVLNADAVEPTAEIRLQPEQIIHGKLFDVNGQPTPMVELQIGSVGRPTNVGLFDGVNLGSARPPHGFRNWPQPVTTDDQGRFSLAGIGRGVTVGINVRDGRLASQTFRIQTDERDGPMEFTQTLQPAIIVEGRVVADDTGQPIPNTAITVSSGLRVRTDERGHYSANASPAARYQIQAFPPEGLPYLPITQGFACANGTVKTTQDVKLPRGLLIHGRVIEHGSGRPLAGASVQWIAARRKAGLIDGWQAVVATKDDGSYQIVVPPGKGRVFVYGPTPDYVLEVIGSRMLFGGKPGGERYYAHDIAPFEVKAGDSPTEINSELRPGMIVKGRLIGPAGQTIDKAEIIALLHFNYFHVNWRGDLTIHARDGSFELHGLDPEKAARVSFLDADHQWGTTVEVSSKRSRKDMTVRLQPSGQAKARFIRPDGKPIARISPHLEILGSTGPPVRSRNPELQEQLSADAAEIVNLDRKHYWNGRLTDAEGRITLPNLIPGASYRISDWSTVNDENKGVQARKDFTVKPGETLELGDILIEKPAQ